MPQVQPGEREHGRWSVSMLRLRIRLHDRGFDYLLNWTKLDPWYKVSIVLTILGIVLLVIGIIT